LAPLKVVSFAFAIPDKAKAANEQGVYLYEYK
jgi:hypothetical protein